MTGPKTNHQKDHEPAIYVVGIGASAGGLEALNTFFENTPHDSAAYIVAQHLSPEHKSLMKELISRHTDLKVVEVVQDMPIEANKIYVIPSKKNMTIGGAGILILEDKPEKRASNNIIDILFTSLAENIKSRAIGIIMSGAGTDGTAGIEAIKKNGGMVVVQDPATAKFDSMPNSAIKTGFADFVLPPDAMADEIINYIKFPAASTFYNERISPVEEIILAEILLLIRSHTGRDFTGYKRPTIIRRLKRRMLYQGFDNMAGYKNFLLEKESERYALSKEFLISVTSFFRDPEAFAEFRDIVIPEIVNKKNPGDPIKIWVAGCATGEEAYSIAILFQEYLDKNKKKVEIKIFASDIDQDALEMAGKGLYPEQIKDHVSPSRLDNYFVRIEKSYKVVPEIRKMLIFALHDVVNDPPFTKIDLLCCRNLLIYFSADLQKRLISTFQFSLNPGGFLFLGNSESKGDSKSSLVSVSPKSKIFKQTDTATASLAPPFKYYDKPHAFNLAPVAIRESLMPDFNSILTDSLLEEFNAAGVCIDRHFEIQLAFGEFKKYLHLPDRLSSFNLLRMVPDTLSIALNNAASKVFKTGEKVMINGIATNQGSGNNRVNIFLKPISNADNRNNNTILVLFTDDETENLPPENQEIFDKDVHLNHRLHALESELKDTKLSLQLAIEQLEASNEELQSTNEELLSANEELQSTNEELQSLNEELYTVNSEHTLKIQELVDLNDDLNNYFRATDIGQLFVDRDLNLRNYTPAACQQINITESDIGRPISHFSNNIKNIDMMSEIKKVIAQPFEIIKEVESTDDRWYLMKIMPYIRKDNRLDGAIITFVDITKMRLLNSVVSGVIESSSSGIVALNAIKSGKKTPTFQLVLNNPKSEELLDLNLEPFKNKPLTRDVPLMDEPLVTAYLDVMETGKAFETENHLKQSDGDKWLKIGIAKMGDGVVLDIDDVTERKNLELEKEKYLKELVSKNTQLQYWAYIAANDLREPMRTITSFASLLKKKNIADIDSEIKEFIGYMVTGAQQMEEMILDLIDYSEIDSSSKPMQTLNADRLLQFGRIPIQEKVKEVGATIIEDTPMPEVSGVISQLAMVFQHLIANAIKFRKADEAPVIHIGAEKKPNAWQFYVKDNGIGFDPQNKDRVFQIFQRLNEKSKYPGTGIGLAICQKIIEKHSGIIWVDPKPGIGCTFYFTLPKIAIKGLGH